MMSNSWTNAISAGTPPMAVLALSRASAIMSFNRTAKRMLGCDLEPGDCWPVDKFFAPKDLPYVKAVFNAVFETGRPLQNQIGFIVNAKGNYNPCRYTASPLFESNRGVLGVILSFQPISSALTPTQNPNPKEHLPVYFPHNYRELVEDLPGGVFTIDLDWRITSFNGAAESITGFSKTQVLGAHCWDIFHSADCQKNCPMRKVFDHAAPQTDHEIMTHDRRGQRQTLIVNAGLLRDPSGEVSGAVQTFRRAGDSVESRHSTQLRFGTIVGKSPAMSALFNMLPDIANSEANVLIAGESGTGKELFARTLHDLSRHRPHPFVAVNCAALSESLLEAELFGHAKGAFTGAVQARPGRFEMAGEGTLFLDEIGELRPDLQVKLLRVLEQRVFERVGGTSPVQFRARVISATHQDIAAALRESRFREDLYYRLRTVPLMIPPLRKRSEDIPLLVNHFIHKFNARTGKRVRAVDPKVMQLFLNAAWPGNVRELERCIEHAFVFVKGPVIFSRHLPDLNELLRPPTSQPEEKKYRSRKMNRERIVQALDQARGNRRKAAALLNISRTSLWRRMKTLGLL
jgi:PAS domain S-box-containing protein